ncbi:hypothetical protein [Aidingimonas halophila]|uniref:Uncharacterized protein n=1 Tax=Aidingimonas halophila TaxID=574349 RepID=A0A1H2ZBC2_9GAMM|nr:hypothetical protein [Aidingimonas halophila]SDX14772.1 hypothetical protein SAMN05443545_10495 [Aidingimonas halophila]
MARYDKSSRRLHGATPRHRMSPFDRWLDRLVSMAVLVAIVVGAAALVITIWPGLH